MLLAAEWGTGQVFLSMVYFFIIFIWIMLLFNVFADLFRSDDLSGWGKFFWIFFVILVPYLGVFVYLIARGPKMAEHRVKDMKAQDEAFRAYVQDAAGGSGGKSAAEELKHLADLKAQGVLSDEEFETMKAKIIAG